ncbi:MAG: Holliday junction resolvase RuvX [Rickettsiales bacterium]
MLVKNQDEFNKALPKEARLLGLDVGEKTIGIAISDLRRVIASPLLTIERKKFSKDIEILKDVISKQDICGLIIGNPLNMDGGSNSRTQSVNTFISNISKQIKLPMTLWDERMSTMAVEKMMIQADMSRKRRGELVDKLAASYILQGYLDKMIKI